MPTRKKNQPAVAAPKQKTHVAFVIDKSGSMSHLRSDVVRVMNDLVEGVKTNSRQNNQETTVSLLTFANVAHPVYIGSHPDGVKPWGLSDYYPGGGTAMLDGVGMAIDELKRLPGQNDPLTSYLVIVLTDGCENQSQHWGQARLNQAIREAQMTDRWSFAFQVPKPDSYGNYKKQLNSQFGIPLDNIREWDQTTQGLVETQVATQTGVGNYFTARAAGQKSVTRFYDVTTDLSQVNTKDVKKALDDISDRFKVLTVPSEKSVKEFIEEKTGSTYVIGSAYYQLMKPEKVQPSKRVLIMEKGKKAIWGGSEARDLIGLPEKDHAKVTPGNHSNYDIFIQSTSVNRKLPRGTKVLLDVTKKKDDTPTWDHTAAGTATK